MYAYVATLQTSTGVLYCTCIVLVLYLVIHAYAVTQESLDGDMVREHGQRAGVASSIVIAPYHYVPLSHTPCRGCLIYASKYYCARVQN